MFYVNFTNFGYFSDEVFQCFDEAVQYSRDKGFETSIHEEVENGLTEIVASFSPISGVKSKIKMTV